MSQRRNYKENEKYNKNKTGQNPMLRRKLIVSNAYIRKEEKTNINNLNSHLKEVKI